MSRVENHPCSWIQGGITLINGRSIAGATRIALLEFSKNGRSQERTPQCSPSFSPGVGLILPIRFVTAGEENPILRQLTFSLLNFTDGLFALRPLMQ